MSFCLRPSPKPGDRMKKATLARLAIRAALFYFTLGEICQSIQAQREIRFRLVHDTLIVV
jgi:hypothetical protein